jgi:hypothetical protein
MAMQNLDQAGTVFEQRMTLPRIAKCFITSQVELVDNNIGKVTWRSTGKKDFANLRHQTSKHGDSRADLYECKGGSQGERISTSRWIWKCWYPRIGLLPSRMLSIIND